MQGLGVRRKRKRMAIHAAQLERKADILAHLFLTPITALDFSGTSALPSTYDWMAAMVTVLRTPSGRFPVLWNSRARSFSRWVKEGQGCDRRIQSFHATVEQTYFNFGA